MYIDIYMYNHTHTHIDTSYMVFVMHIRTFFNECCFLLRYHTTVQPHLMVGKQKPINLPQADRDLVLAATLRSRLHRTGFRRDACYIYLEST